MTENSATTNDLATTQEVQDDEWLETKLPTMGDFAWYEDYRKSVFDYGNIKEYAPLKERFVSSVEGDEGNKSFVSTTSTSTSVAGSDAIVVSEPQNEEAVPGTEQPDLNEIWQEVVKNGNFEKFEKKQIDSVEGDEDNQTPISTSAEGTDVVSTTVVSTTTSPDGTELPDGTDVVSTTVVSTTTSPDGTELPDGTDVVSTNVVSTTTSPDGTELPDGTEPEK